MTTSTTNTNPAAIAPRDIVLRSLKYDGSLNYSWPATLLWQDAGGFVWSTPAGAPFTRPSRVEPVPFDWIGRVWYDRWYLVDASLLPGAGPQKAGIIDHYYINIVAPGAWEDAEYRYVDLDLDVLFYPDGRHALLDEDEFAANGARFGYTAAVIDAAQEAVSEVLAQARASTPPFDGTLATWHRSLHAPPPPPDGTSRRDSMPS